MKEQVVAEVEFDVARNADDNPTGQVLKNAFGSGDGHQQKRVDEQLASGDAVLKGVESATNNLREQNPDTIVREDTDGSEKKSALVLR